MNELFDLLLAGGLSTASGSSSSSNHLSDWRGLLNQYQELNCFLNACVQALYELCRWFLRPFREQILRSPLHCNQPDCFCCTVQRLFQQYAAVPREVPVNISELRQLLAKEHASSRNFELYKPADAMEALDAVLKGIHASCSGTCPASCAVHSIFPGKLIERFTCEHCGSKKEEEWPQFMDYCRANYIHSRSENTEILKSRFDEDFVANSTLMTVAEQLPQRIVESWNSDAHLQCSQPQCSGKLLKREMALQEQPACYVLNLGWEQRHAHPLHIAQVLVSLPQVLDLRSVYKELTSCTYMLSGLVMYQREHYFYCHNDDGVWYVLDDNKVKRFNNGKESTLFAAMALDGAQPVGALYTRGEHLVTRSRHAVDVIRLELGIAREMIELNNRFSRTPDESKCWFCSSPHEHQGLFCKQCGEYPYAKGTVTRRTFSCTRCRNVVGTFDTHCTGCGNSPKVTVTCFNCATHFRKNVRHCLDCGFGQTTCLDCSREIPQNEPKFCPTCLTSLRVSFCAQCHTVNPKPVCNICKSWDCLVCNTHNTHTTKCTRCESLRPCGNARNQQGMVCSACSVSLTREQSQQCYLCRQPTINWVCKNCRVCVYPHNYACSACLTETWTCGLCLTKLSKVCVVCPYHLS